MERKRSASRAST